MSLVACTAKLKVSATSANKTADSTQAPMVVTSVAKLVTSPGETFGITGANFRSSMTVSASTDSLTDNGQSASTAKIQVKSDSQASITMPAQQGFGGYTMTLVQDGAKQQLALFSNGGKLDYPIITVSADKICSDIAFYDAMGSLQEGTKNCRGGSSNNCAADGAVSCFATKDFPATATVGLANKVLAGATVAGVAGTVTLPLATAENGGTG